MYMAACAVNKLTRIRRCKSVCNVFHDNHRNENNSRQKNHRHKNHEEEVIQNGRYHRPRHLFIYLFIFFNFYNIAFREAGLLAELKLSHGGPLHGVGFVVATFAAVALQAQYFHEESSESSEPPRDRLFLWRMEDVDDDDDEEDCNGSHPEDCRQVDSWNIEKRWRTAKSILTKATL